MMGCRCPNESEKIGKLYFSLNFWPYEQKNKAQQFENPTAKNKAICQFLDAREHFMNFNISNMYSKISFKVPKFSPKYRFVAFNSPFKKKNEF